MWSHRKNIIVTYQPSYKLSSFSATSFRRAWLLHCSWEICAFKNDSTYTFTYYMASMFFQNKNFLFMKTYFKGLVLLFCPYHSKLLFHCTEMTVWDFSSFCLPFLFVLKFKFCHFAANHCFQGNSNKCKQTFNVQILCLLKFFVQFEKTINTRLGTNVLPPFFSTFDCQKQKNLHKQRQIQRSSVVTVSDILLVPICVLACLVTLYNSSSNDWMDS